MAARYAMPKDSYTEVLLNGYRDYKKPTQGKMQYPDAAQMAIIEFINANSSVSYLLAKHSLPKHESLLADLEQQLSPANKTRLTFRQIEMLEQKKLSLEKSTRKYREKIADRDGAWMAERVFLENNVEKYQMMFDAKQTTLDALETLGFEVADGVVSVKVFAVKDNHVVDEPIAKSGDVSAVDRSIDVEVVEQKPGFLKKLFGYKK